MPKKLAAAEAKSEIRKALLNKKYKYLIAILGGKVVGVCYIDITFIHFQVIRIGNLLVKEDQRGKGVGSVLIDKVIEFANKNNVKKIWLWSHKELKDATNLYKKKGFKVEWLQKSQFCGKDTLLFGLVL